MLDELVALFLVLFILTRRLYDSLSHLWEELLCIALFWRWKIVNALHAQRLGRRLCDQCTLCRLRAKALRFELIHDQQGVPADRC